MPASLADLQERLAAQMGRQPSMRELFQAAEQEFPGQAGDAPLPPPAQPLKNLAPEEDIQMLLRDLLLKTAGDRPDGINSLRIQGANALGAAGSSVGQGLTGPGNRPIGNPGGLSGGGGGGGQIPIRP